MLNTITIGNRIAGARKKMNISQAELAQHLFISSQAVGKWERGESMPDIITLNRLAEVLNVDLNYFSGSSQAEVSEAVEFPTEKQNQSAVPAGKDKKPKWDMSRGSWADADFSGLKNLNEKFSSSHMKNCLFIGSDLSGLQLSSNHIDGCDFSGSDISKSQIKGSHLANNNFKDCLLKEAGFSGSYMQGCDFSGADFSGTEIKSGGFSKNTIAGAKWNQTSFNTVYLADLIFDGLVEDCSFESCSFTRVTFQNATLINTFFKNRSLKRIRFVDCKADRMTYEFLKNGKADLTGIVLLES